MKRGKHKRTEGMLPFFSSFLAIHKHMEFPGQGSDLSCSCDLRCSCCNAGSFNPLCQARDRTCILALQRHHQYHCTTLGTLHLHFRSKITISHSWHVWVPECLLVLSTIHVTWTSNLAFVVQFWLHISNIFIPQYYCFQVWIYNLVIQIKHQTKFSNFYTYFNSLF